MSAIDYMLRTSNLEMRIGGIRYLLGQVVDGKLQINKPLFDDLGYVAKSRANRLIEAANKAISYKLSAE